ncbi:MAG: DUF416 family protein [bacterium]|jgi:hypothetical protein
MHTFSFDNLARQLLDLSPRARMVFAACCAQRCACVYEQAVQIDRSEMCPCVHQALEYIWNQLSDLMDDDQGDELAEKLEALLSPDDPRVWRRTMAYIDDSITVCIYAIECLKAGGHQEAVWAGEVARQCVWQIIDDYLENESFTAESILKVESHSIVQRELARQERDVAELAASGSILTLEMIGRFRQRSKIEQAVERLPLP